MIERSVACFPADKARLAHMRGALGAFTSLRPFTDLNELEEAIRAGRLSATVVIVDLPTFDRAETALKRIHNSFSAHPLVAYYNPNGLTPKHFVALALSGVTDLVQLDVDDSRHLFGRIIDSASRVNHAQMLMELLGHEVPKPVRAVFEFALEHAGDNMQVPELVAALGLRQRTLLWRLRKYGMPAPGRFLMWCRLLVAARLLDERGHTLDSVADLLGFSNGHTLGNAIFRYLNSGVKTLRETGVLIEVAAAFRLEIGKPRSSLPPTLREG